MNPVMLDHFGFKRYPFTPEIDPGSLLDFRHFHQGRLRLEQATHQRGLALVVGEAGAGKTALARALRQRLSSSDFRALYCAVLPGKNPLRPVVDDLLTQLGEKVPFNNVPKGIGLLQKTLLRLYEANQLPVVILDDVHYLNATAWQLLKGLTNYEMDSRVPLCVWLLGDREGTLAVLNWRQLAEVRGRLLWCYHLRGLELGEAESYLQTHLKWAGCDRPLFPKEVAQELHQRARGLPRELNRLAHTCLLSAAFERKDLVDMPCLEQAASELLMSPVERR